MTCVLVQPLVGVDADGPGIGEAKRPFRPHPLADQVQCQPFAQLDPEHLVEPGLRNVEDEQHAGNLGEDDQLVQERLKIAALQRIIERSIPAVEDNLADCRRDDHDKDAGGEHEYGVAQRRRHESPAQHLHLNQQIFLGRPWLGSGFFGHAISLGRTLYRQWTISLSGRPVSHNAAA